MQLKVYNWIYNILVRKAEKPLKEAVRAVNFNY